MSFGGVKRPQSSASKARPLPSSPGLKLAVNTSVKSAATSKSSSQASSTLASPKSKPILVKKTSIAPPKSQPSHIRQKSLTTAPKKPVVGPKKSAPGHSRTKSSTAAVKSVGKVVPGKKAGPVVRRGASRSAGGKKPLSEIANNVPFEDFSKIKTVGAAQEKLKDIMNRLFGIHYDPEIDYFHVDHANIAQVYMWLAVCKPDMASGCWRNSNSKNSSEFMKMMKLKKLSLHKMELTEEARKQRLYSHPGIENFDESQAESVVRHHPLRCELFHPDPVKPAQLKPLAAVKKWKSENLHLYQACLRPSHLCYGSQEAHISDQLLGKNVSKGLFKEWAQSSLRSLDSHGNNSWKAIAASPQVQEEIKVAEEAEAAERAAEEAEKIRITEARERARQEAEARAAAAAIAEAARDIEEEETEEAKGETATNEQKLAAGNGESPSGHEEGGEAAGAVGQDAELNAAALEQVGEDVEEGDEEEENSEESEGGSSAAAEAEEQGEGSSGEQEEDQGEEEEEEEEEADDSAAEEEEIIVDNDVDSVEPVSVAQDDSELFDDDLDVEAQTFMLIDNQMATARTVGVENLSEAKAEIDRLQRIVRELVKQREVLTEENINLNIRITDVVSNYDLQKRESVVFQGNDGAILPAAQLYSLNESSESVELAEEEEKKREESADEQKSQEQNTSEEGTSTTDESDAAAKVE
jgi:hypothetical protein